MFKKNYISFDIFDTLLARNVNKPSDIFELVEIEYNKISNNKISNFKNIRINSEKIAREKSKYDEIKIDEIYDEVKNELKEVDINKLKELEKTIEYDLITRNNNENVYKIYENAINNKTKIVLISDMYLPKDFIESILKKCNIKYDKLYLSEDLRINKATGKIFEYVLKDLNINGKELTHIGDNKKSDYYIPKKYGIKSILVKNNNDLKYTNLNVNSNFDYKMLSSILTNYYDKTLNYFSNFGYECLGPLLLGFSNWLKNNLTENNIKNVYFLARDGKIMKKAFDLFYGNDFNTYYLYGSRRSLIVPSLWKYKDILEIFDNMFLPKEIKLSRILDQFGIDNYDINNYLKENNMDLEKIYKLNDLKTIHLPFFKSIHHLIIENSKNEYNSMINYFNKNNFNGKVALVDIGWFGNMQKAIEFNIENANINGYYLGIIPNSKNQLKYNMKGFLFEKDKNCYLYDQEHYFNSILEFIFSTNHGSVKKFKKENVEFYNYEYESSYEDKYLYDIQNGAIKFLDDIKKNNLLKYLNLNEISSFQNIINFALNPSLEDAINFGNVKFTGNEYPYIANPKSLKYYIIHPKKFMTDYKNAKWRIGFCKRVFKVKLPYYKINKLIRKYYLKNEEKNG